VRPARGTTTVAVVAVRLERVKTKKRNITTADESVVCVAAATGCVYGRAFVKRGRVDATTFRGDPTVIASGGVDKRRNTNDEDETIE